MNRINAEIAAEDFPALLRFAFGDTTSRIQAIDIERAIQHGKLNIESAVCGCFECDTGVRPGHFACEVPSDWALEMERAGLVVRGYDDGVWRWFVA